MSPHGATKGEEDPDVFHGERTPSVGGASQGIKKAAISSFRYQTQKKGKGMSRELEELKMGQNGGMKEIARSPAPSGNSFATHSLANNR